jgi:hypothetical protein
MIEEQRHAGGAREGGRMGLNLHIETLPEQKQERRMGTFTVDPHGHMTEAQVLRRARQLSRALFREMQQRQRFEEYVWYTHKWLDDQGAPRGDINGEVLSLVGRMTWLMTNPK